MNLKEYIRQAGDSNAAKLFRVSQRTAASWRRGERNPRPDKAREIVRKTNGLLTFEDCY